MAYSTYLCMSVCSLGTFDIWFQDQILRLFIPTPDSDAHLFLCRYARVQVVVEVFGRLDWLAFEVRQHVTDI